MLASAARKFARVEMRFVLEGREPDWRARSGRVWVSKITFMAVGEELDRTSALRAAFFTW